MDYCTYGHMIDNVVLIVTGTLHERDVQVGLSQLFELLWGHSLPDTVGHIHQNQMKPAFRASSAHGVTRT